ncbi:hypothetical protein BD770DRAFT_449972 [Pilaira anomala]|nr:hypothetical protein BD770DRAFT_449972 [Pilaira anomala]
MESIISTFVGLLFPHTMQVMKKMEKFIFYYMKHTLVRAVEEKFHLNLLSIRVMPCIPLVSETLKTMVHPDIGPVQLTKGFHASNAEEDELDDFEREILNRGNRTAPNIHNDDEYIEDNMSIDNRRSSNNNNRDMDDDDFDDSFFRSDDYLNTRRFSDSSSVSPPPPKVNKPVSSKKKDKTDIIWKNDSSDKTLRQFSSTNKTSLRSKVYKDPQNKPHSKKAEYSSAFNYSRNQKQSESFPDPLYVESLKNLTLNDFDTESTRDMPSSSKQFTGRRRDSINSDTNSHVTSISNAETEFSQGSQNSASKKRMSNSFETDVNNNQGKRSKANDGSKSKNPTIPRELVELKGEEDLKRCL